MNKIISKEHFSENISCRYPHNALSSNRCFDNFFRQRLRKE